MTVRARLDDIAALCGIAPGYDDTGGRYHRVSADTLRRVLRGLGVHCAGPAETEARIAELEASRWRRRLPPVCLGRAGTDEIEVALTRPASEAARPVAWTLDEESGRTLRGETSASSLHELDRRLVDGEPWVEQKFTITAPSAMGYHRLALREPGTAAAAASSLVIHAPRRCYRPAAIENGQGLWGLTVQLYGLRTQRNWGIGDFTDLMRFVEQAAAAGAGFVGLNPLHPPKRFDNDEASPYSPSSLRALNPLYLDVEAIPDFAECEDAQALAAGADFQSRLQSLRRNELVDYVAVATAKLEVTERLFVSFCARHRDSGGERGREFADFSAQRGDVVDYALYEAILEEQGRTDARARGWPDWPEPLQDRGSAAVAEALVRLRQRVEYFVYLQWNAERQLSAAARRAEDLGMPIGIYTDLPLAPAWGGADTWLNRELYVEDLHIGAPPDDFNPAGQDWGLPPLHPEALREAAYRPFIETLRANMRVGGALRIDHVMALCRLFLIPSGQSPGGGAYVHYNLDELAAIVALESRRNRCLVIGEDLGTVPQALRTRLGQIGALGTRVLYFERDSSGSYKAPAAFEREALAVVSTHDLPTLAGFWQGTDLERRSELGPSPPDSVTEQQRSERAGDRARLLMALERQGLLPPGQLTDGTMNPSLSLAVHAYLARSASRLVGIQTEDLIGETEQANLPGTTSEHPNWRRRLSLEIDRLTEIPAAEATFGMLRELRPRSGNEHTAAGDAAVAAPAHARSASRIPRATYRIQLNGSFRFEDLTAIVPYLDELGISHCYCSPYLKARPGSLHGYDIVDHAALNPEIGGFDELKLLCESLAARGMGHLLDMVPNHMAVMGRDNAWWLNLLENGMASPYAAYFDIDWHPLKPELDGKVLVPVLGDHYGNVLDAGGFELVYDRDDGAFCIDYFEHRFPIDPREYPRILAPDLESLRRRANDGESAIVELESLITALAKLPPRTSTSEEAKAERARDRDVNLRRLAELVSSSSDVDRYIDECVRAFNGSENRPPDRHRLHDLLEAQAYRLAYWRVASDEINYRRFFDINELASLRQENPEVFDATHSLVLDLIDAGKLDGLRIDHPDGLYDPRAYFRRLQASAGAGPDAGDRPLYLVAEKILAHGERLRPDWPVHGTTGYEFANLLNRFFVDPEGIQTLASIEADFVGGAIRYADVVYRSKRLIMQTGLASELAVLVADLDRLAEQDPHTRDFGLGGLRNALLETIACFPVYRTYIADGELSAHDGDAIARAVDAAKARSEAADTSVFEFLRDVLLNREPTARAAALRAHAERFGMQLQQYTSPVAAKGTEDTAFYRHARLIALNEVGGTPERPSASAETVHAENAERLEQWPHSMLGTSTHDSKRSEDVRARLAVLSEMPYEWARLVDRWGEINEPLKPLTDDGLRWPDRTTEYFVYQTLLGAWPLEPLTPATRADFVERMQAYMLKAVKEAKLHTSWINPNPDYESALADFVRYLLDPTLGARFLEEFEPLQQCVSSLGLLNALTQVVLKLTCPGLPDIYQGNELWRFDLVDPDNRRPVDYGRRRELLQALERAARTLAPDALEHDLVTAIEDGRLKLFVTWRLLGLRRAKPGLFERGSYRPLRVRGDCSEHVLAFARELGGETLITAVARRFLDLTGEDLRFDRTRLGNTEILLPPSASAYRDQLFARAPGRAARRATAAGNPEHTWVAAQSVLTQVPVAVWTG